MLRRMLRALRYGLVFIAAFVLVAMAVVRCDPVFGARPEGARQTRIEHSPEWKNDRFSNPAPMWSDTGIASMAGMLRSVPGAAPVEPVPYARDTATRLATPPASGLRVTWFGHSWSFLEVDGKRMVIDPIASKRASPFQFLGPARWFDPPLALSALRDVDAVLISHDHYDHLDMDSIRTLAKGHARFIVPLGVGAHLERWGVAPGRITELDWWDATHLGDVEITATPARHASGRVNPQRDRTLWAGYAVRGPQHSAWYSGDTGLTDQFKAVGERLGPFDVTLIETGQYDKRWPDWHIGPEQAVQAHLWARGKVMIPVHWGLFNLAQHGWTEPAERSLLAAHCARVMLATPAPGMPYEPGIDQTGRWWPVSPWQSVTEAPIVATTDGSRAHLYAPLVCRQAPAP